MRFNDVYMPLPIAVRVHLARSRTIDPTAFLSGPSQFDARTSAPGVFRDFRERLYRCELRKMAVQIDAGANRVDRFEIVMPPGSSDA